MKTKFFAAGSLFLMAAFAVGYATWPGHSPASKSRGPASISDADSVDSIRPTFDAHIHLSTGDSIEDNVQIVTDFIRERHLQKVFVLSDAFRNDNYNEPRTQDRRYLQNEFTKNAVHQLPDSVIGLCGYKATWEDGVEVLSACLQHEKMQGIKTRPFDDTYHIQDPEISANIRELLTAHSGKIKYFLIHMASEAVDIECNHPDDEDGIASALENDKREVDALLNFALLFPQTRFIIAHSYSSHQLVRYTTQRKNALAASERQTLSSQGRTSIENVWIDTSTAFTNRLAQQLDFTNSNRPVAELEQRRREFVTQLISAWREFGIQYVVFGSDQMLGGTASKIADSTTEEFENQIAALKADYSSLTETELRQIMQSNWQTLVR